MRKISGFLKQNKNYICVILTWVVNLLIFYYLDYKVYGGNLNLSFMGVLIYPPIYAFIYIINEEDRNERIKKQTKLGKKISNVITNIIFMAFGFILTWSILYNNPYQIKAYQILSALLFLAMILFIPQYKQLEQIVNKKDWACLLTNLFIIEILVVLIFCIIARPMTVREGKRLVADVGYEDIEYIVNIEDLVILRTITGYEDVLLSKHEDSMNFYLYRGTKNGENYGIIISVISHRIVTEINSEENNVLLYYYNN